MYESLSAELIAKRLRDLNLSRSDISNDLGPSRTTVNNWISGRSEPTGELYRKLIHKLGLTINKKGFLEIHIIKENMVPIFNISEQYSIDSKSYYKTSKNIDIIIRINVNNNLLPINSTLFCKKINTEQELGMTKIGVIIINKKIEVSKLIFANDNIYKDNINMKINKDDIKFRVLEIL
jgi:transcriptional regulator with XRE-family HTH domain